MSEIEDGLAADDQTVETPLVPPEKEVEYDEECPPDASAIQDDINYILEATVGNLGIIEEIYSAFKDVPETRHTLQTILKNWSFQLTYTNMFVKNLPLPAFYEEGLSPNYRNITTAAKNLPTISEIGPLRNRELVAEKDENVGEKEGNGNSKGNEEKEGKVEEKEEDDNWKENRGNFEAKMKFENPGRERISRNEGENGEKFGKAGKNDEIPYHGENIEIIRKQEKRDNRGKIETMENGGKFAEIEKVGNGGNRENRERDEKSENREKYGKVNGNGERNGESEDNEKGHGEFENDEERNEEDDNEVNNNEDDKEVNNNEEDDKEVNNNEEDDNEVNNNEEDDNEEDDDEVNNEEEDNEKISENPKTGEKAKIRGNEVTVKNYEKSETKGDEGKEGEFKSVEKSKKSKSKKAVRFSTREIRKYFYNNENEDSNIMKKDDNFTKKEDNFTKKGENVVKNHDYSIYDEALENFVLLENSNDEALSETTDEASSRIAINTGIAKMKYHRNPRKIMPGTVVRIMEYLINVNMRDKYAISILAGKESGRYVREKMKRALEISQTMDEFVAYVVLHDSIHKGTFILPMDNRLEKWKSIGHETRRVIFNEIYHGLSKHKNSSLRKDFSRIANQYCRIKHDDWLHVLSFHSVLTKALVLFYKMKVYREARLNGVKIPSKIPSLDNSLAKFLAKEYDRECFVDMSGILNFWKSTGGFRQINDVLNHLNNEDAKRMKLDLLGDGPGGNQITQKHLTPAIFKDFISDMDYLVMYPFCKFNRKMNN